MATDSFKFWDSYMHGLDKVDDATAGRLIKALCHEVFLGEEPDFTDEPLLGLAYEVMRGQAIQSRDLSRIARESGTRGGRPKKGAERVPKGSEKGAKSEKRRSEANRKEASLSSLEKKATPRGAAAAAPGGAPTAPREPRDPHDVSDAPLEQWPPPGWAPPPPLNNS